VALGGIIFSHLEHQPSISVIVTALNEEKNVFPFLSHLRNFLETHHISHEVIFIDDGSSDRTFAEAHRLQSWTHLKTVRLERNHGSGGAIKEALKNTKGEWYAWLPCDLEILPEELLKPYELRQDFDVVITYFASGRETRSLFRRIMSFLFTGVLNLSFGQSLPYYNGLTLIRRDLIQPDQIFSNGFFFHAELLIRTLKTAKRTATVPIKLSPRLAEKPKALKFKVFKDVLLCFLRTFWEVKISHARSNY